MDAQVENHLGDSISYKVAGSDPTAPPTIMLGFLELIIDDVDAIKRQWQLQISRRYLPTGPKRGDVLTSPRLAGLYKPSQDTPTLDGDAWLFIIQKA